MTDEGARLPVGDTGGHMRDMGADLVGGEWRLIAR